MDDQAILRKLDALSERIESLTGPLNKPELTLPECALYTGFTESTICTWISTGEMKHLNPQTGEGEFHRVRGRLRFFREKIDKWTYANSSLVEMEKGKSEHGVPMASDFKQGG